jgi:hypothetical protein
MKLNLTELTEEDERSKKNARRTSFGQKYRFDS